MVNFYFSLLPQYRYSPNSAHNFLEASVRGGDWRELSFSPGQSVHYTETTLSNPETVVIAEPAFYIRRNVLCRIRGTEEVVESEQKIVGYTRTTSGQFLMLVALQESSSKNSSFLVEEVDPDFIQPWAHEQEIGSSADHITTLMSAIDAIECSIRPSELSVQ